jgi:tripartite-type tricarboxylate transporter receptor subunit TctC
MKCRNWTALVVGLIVIVCRTGWAQETNYPSKPVHILVPFTAGTNADIIARIYGKKLATRLGQPFVVDDRPGAGGVVAAQALLAAPADGYTLLFVSGSHSANPSFYKNLPYDTVNDFTGITYVGSSPTVLAVSTALSVKTLQQFRALVASHPGQMNYGSAGVGSATHLACRSFLKAAKLDMTHIPYKGVQEVIVEVMAGRLQLGCPPVGLVAAQIKAGKVVGLAVLSSKRTSLLPDVPAAAEAGLPGAEFGVWYGLIAAKKLPRPIVERLAREMGAISADPDVAQKLLAQGVVSKVIQLSEFDAFIKADVERVKALVGEQAAGAS